MSIIKAGNVYHLNACINYDIANVDNRYCKGYFLAAKTLINELKKSNIHIDHLVYPIVFLYRQYIELKIKFLLKNIKSRKSSIPKTHNIMRLFNILQHETSHSYQLDDVKIKGFLTEIKAKIQQIDNIDPSSLYFRYSHDENNQVYLPNGCHYIDLCCLELLMDDIDNLMDKVEWFIDVSE